MKWRTCAKGQIRLPVLGVGAWSFGGTAKDYWGPQNQAETDRLVARALDLGCVYFDTAEVYNQGASEEALGRALKGRRSEAIVGSKIPPIFCRRATLRTHCEASLRRLQTDYLDLYMIHWPLDTAEKGPEGDRPSVEEAFDAMATLKKEGKIRHIGVSNFGISQLREAMSTGVEIAVNELPYGLLCRAIEWEVLPFCREHDIGVIAYMTLMQGLLTDRFSNFDELPPNRTRTRHFSSARPGTRHGEAGFESLTRETIHAIQAAAREWGWPTEQVALAWAMAQPGVTCTLAGMRKVEQLEANARAVALELDWPPRQRLDEISRPLLEAWGRSVDLWEPPGRSRTR